MRRGGKLRTYRPAFEYEVKHLMNTPVAFYEGVGVKCRPFHFFDGTTHPFPLRATLLDRLSLMVHQESFPYVTGESVGGSGKSFILRRLIEQLIMSSGVLVIEVADLVGFRHPQHAINIVCQELESVLTKSTSEIKVLILDEVEFPSVFELGLSLGCKIAAAGHYLQRDAGKAASRFEVVDIDIEYPLATDAILKHLLVQLEHANAVHIVNRPIVELVARCGSGRLLLRSSNNTQAC